MAVLPGADGSGGGNLSASPRFGNNNTKQKIHRFVTKEKDKSILHKNSLRSFDFLVFLEFLLIVFKMNKH